MLRKDKVFAYITQGARLLVFRERGFEGFGLQIPAGSPHEEEALERAVLRESQEETGLEGLRIVAYLGSVSADQTKYGINEIHDRHFYHLAYDGIARDTWEHIEADPSMVTESTPEVIVFELRWIDISLEIPALAEGHDAYLGTLLERLDTNQRLP